MLYLYPMLIASSKPRIISTECFSTLSMGISRGTFADSLGAYSAENFIDGADGVLVFDDIAMLR
jgi:hypothetical protein